MNATHLIDSDESILKKLTATVSLSFVFYGVSFKSVAELLLGVTVQCSLGQEFFNTCHYGQTELSRGVKPKYQAELNLKL